MVREWLLDSEEKDRLRKVLKEILAEALVKRYSFLPRTPTDEKVDFVERKLLRRALVGHCPTSCASKCVKFAADGEQVKCRSRWKAFARRWACG
jgi:hypothetical protein